MHTLARTPEARQRISEGNRQKYKRWTKEKWEDFRRNCSKGWTQESRDTMKEKVKRPKNGMFQKSYYERWVELYGKEKADNMMKAHREKISKISKEINGKPEVRAKFQETTRIRQQCEHYSSWQKARGQYQRLLVRFKKQEISKEEFDSKYSIMKQEVERLSKLIEKEKEAIRNAEQNREVV